MAEGKSSSPEIARRARRRFAEQLAEAGPRLLAAVLEAARSALDKPAERSVAMQRRDTMQALMGHGQEWIDRQTEMLRDAAAADGIVNTSTGALVASMQGRTQQLMLVDDETVQKEIFVSRLAQAIVDDAVWELNDLKTRIAALEGLEDLNDHDLFRPQQLAKIVVRAFVDSDFGSGAWADVEQAIKLELAALATEAYHDANRFLVERGVLPEVNLRTLIRRSVDRAPPMVASRQMPLEDFRSTSGGDVTTGGGQFTPTEYGGPGGHGVGPGGYAHSQRGGQTTYGGGPGGQTTYGAGPSGQTTYGGVPGGQTTYGGVPGGHGSGYVGQGGHPAAPAQAGGPDSESGALNGAPNVGVTSKAKPGASGADGQFLSPQQVQVDATLRRFGRTMERHVQGFMNTQRFAPPSNVMTGAIAVAQRVVVEQVQARHVEGAVLAPAEIVGVLQEQKQTLKTQANTQEERAIIEVVAMMFASILTEERIPPAVRVWFARLQMPTLRVAMAEPDFFSSAQHPARRLIDRMGACVMGFDAAPQGAGPEIESEVARVVQVVEAFPETGRKVFQTVLVEFERFLERFFREQNETTRKGVSLASQVEQRETLAIQYTIELRKLLDGVPVQDGVRDFLFQVWADILATTAMRHGLQSQETRVMRETALELVWIASAKTTREERAEVIRRLGPLLASLRSGMAAGAVPVDRQESSLRALNIALTAAFAARTATIDPDQFGRLKQRLQALDEILPDADFELDDSFALDLSGHESDELEIVAEGGATPTAGALAATDEMLVGAWYMLEYRDRQEAVQLTWQGMRKQLSLFVSSGGRCVLFQRRRLAAFLQAQLLVPAQDETLTIAATRSAIEKINQDPDRLK